MQRLNLFSSDPLIGARVLDGYFISGVLGAGGMGTVYVAEHQRIGKRVVIKVLHPHLLANADVVGRFLAEARAAAALDHPNIVDVIGTGRLADGRDYIAFEYLVGQPLNAMLHEHGRLPPATVLRILAQICCGLEAAHQRGIVHRDLKPANLLVAPTELRPLRIKILDFGIAKLDDTVLAGGIETSTSAVAGTPCYMAPEQARGMRGVDHRADIYSVGAIAYEMLTGQTPYDGDSIGEVVFQQLSAPPPSLRALRPDLAPGWIDAIMACVGADPAMRPPSARDLIMRLIAVTPYGAEIVREVAPLLFAPAWIAGNRALVAPLAIAVRPAPPPPGGTATYEPTAPERPRSKTPRRGQRRRVVAAVAGAAAAVAIVAAAISAAAVQHAAAAHDLPPAEHPGIVATSETPAPTLPQEQEPPEIVGIDLVLEPPDAALEINGTLTSARRLELAPGTEVSVVVRRSGYRPDRRRLRAERSAVVEIALEPAPRRARRRTSALDDVPLSVLFGP